MPKKALSSRSLRSFGSETKLCLYINTYHSNSNKNVTKKHGTEISLGDNLTDDLGNGKLSEIFRPQSYLSATTSMDANKNR